VLRNASPDFRFAAMPENGRFDFPRSRSGFGEGLAQNLPL
jgi:hypothetical protein